MAPGTLVGELEATLSEVVSTESRLAASVTLLVATTVVAVFLTPRVVDWTTASAKQLTDRQNRIAVPDRDLGWLLPTWVLVRALQFTALVVTGVALLVVWGYVEVAVLVVDAVISVLPLLGRLVATGTLLVSVVVGTDLLEAQLSRYAETTEGLNDHQQGIAFRVLQLVLLIAVGMGVLTVWNFNVDGLLVGAGFLGIVVGMAARQTLGSLIAGFVLMFSKPFKLGDWIVIGQHEGIVTDVTIVNTRLWNFDGETVVLPNDMVNNSTVKNRTERGRLRLSVPVGVDYDTDLDHARGVVETAVAEVDTVLDVPKPEAVPDAFEDSAITLDVRVWIDAPNSRKRWQTRASVVQAVKEAFEREEIDIPFPQRVFSERTARTEGEEEFTTPPTADD